MYGQNMYGLCEWLTYITIIRFEEALNLPKLFGSATNAIISTVVYSVYMKYNGVIGSLISVELEIRFTVVMIADILAT